MIPVFGIWSDWNDGTSALGWTHFSANPLSAAPCLAPAAVSASPVLFGVALAGGGHGRGSVRSEALSPPEWIAPPLPETQVQITLAPGTSDGPGTVELTSPTSVMLANITARSSSGVLSFTLPAGFTRLSFVAKR